MANVGSGRTATDELVSEGGRSDDTQLCLVIDRSGKLISKFDLLKAIVEGVHSCQVKPMISLTSVKEMCAE
jgi:hypothetical protein